MVPKTGEPLRKVTPIYIIALPQFPSIRKYRLHPDKPFPLSLSFFRTQKTCFDSCIQSSRDNRDNNYQGLVLHKKSIEAACGIKTNF